jgi:hypothetical protein
VTIYIPKPLLGLAALGAAIFAVYFAYEEVPALRRYIKFELM